MKISKILIILLLVIITIGVVSASDNDITSDSLTDNGDLDLESSVEDTSLEDSNSDILGDGSTGTYEELDSLIVSSNINDIIKLDKDYVWTNTTQDDFTQGVNIGKKLTIDGQGHKIDGLNVSRIFNVNAHGVLFKNIVFVNTKAPGPGGAIFFDNVNLCTVSNCTFINCSAHQGGGVCSSGSGTSILSCNFTNCFSLISDGAECGGALSLSRDATVFNCHFTDCFSNLEGGAIRAENNFNISDCSFVNCSNNDIGGALRLLNKGTVFNCSFVNCSSKTHIAGAIYWDGGNANLLNCTFINCSAFEDYGGAVQMDDNDWIVSGCSFENCYALHAGGSLILTGRGLVSKCRFIDSYSEEGGGAIDANNDKQDFNPFINISDCSFVNCISDHIGGAIWGRGTTGIISNCDFKNCLVNGSDPNSYGGGAIWCSFFEISYCTFEECSATDSGAIRADSTNISYCSFIDCSAEANGGAINWYSENNHVSHCSFVNCTAGGGGAIQFSGWTSNMYDAISDCSFVNCAADGGGAISGSLNGTIANSTFVNCSSDNGGAILMIDNTTITVRGCNFINCSADNGGALFGECNENIISCYFMNCLSNYNGGAIDLDDENNSIINCSFEKCSARNGGAIFLNAKNITVSDCLFKENVAYSDGGAIFTLAELTIDNSQFINNSANYSKGGALYLNSNTTIKYSLFDGNDAYIGKYIWTETNNISAISNRFMLAVGEDRDDIIGGASLNILKGTNDIYYGGRLVLFPQINISYSDLLVGENETVNVSLPNDVTGEMTITLYKGGSVVQTNNYNLNAVTKVFADLALGVYNITVNYLGDENYFDNEKSVIFMVRPVVDITQNVIVGDDASISSDLISATGRVKIYIDGDEYLIQPINDNKLNCIFNTNDFSYGDHNITLEYLGTSFDKNVFNYWDNETNTYIPYKYDFHLEPFVINVDDTLGSKSNDEGVVIVELPKDATGTIIVYVEGSQTAVVSVINGIARIDLSAYKDGSYKITFRYSGDTKYLGFIKEGITALHNDVPEKITANGFSLIYTSNNQYSIVVLTKTNKGVSGVVVYFLINGKSYTSAKTNSKGIASITISNAPGSYKITSKIKNIAVTKTLTVKHLVSLKSVNVKKSAKKLVLQSTLSKVNGKYIKNKKVTFKFNGKKYTAKTNSKGVAKVIIKSNVLKKLKAGKKVTYQASYLKDTVKKTVKIKK